MPLGMGIGVCLARNENLDPQIHMVFPNFGGKEVPLFDLMKLVIE